MEHTDLENKLFGYIRFLLGLINTYELAVKYLYEGYKSVSEWTVRSFEDQSKHGSIISMIEDLNKEFNWDAKVVSSLPKEDQDASVGTD